MAHEIKKILMDKQDELKPIFIHQKGESNVSGLMLTSNCLPRENSSLNSPNKNLLNLKNSFATNTNVIVSTQNSLPQSNLSSSMENSCGSKLNLNNSGASVSPINSSSTTTSMMEKSPQINVGNKMGSRRIFTPQFKLQVLESYRNDNDCKGNQRATARKYGIHRRQIQKWLQCENNLRSIIANNPQNIRSNNVKLVSKATAPILSSSTCSRQRGVVVNTDKNGVYSCFSLANVKKSKACNSVETLSTKSLPSASLHFGEFASENSINCSTSTIESNKYIISNNQFDYDSDLHLYNIYNRAIDDHPIDLSCNQSKVKTENVARPIPIHPSSSHYKNPFYNYNSNFSSSNLSLHHYQTSPSPQLTDISNSIKKAELAYPIDLSITNLSQKRKYKKDIKNDDDNNKPLKLFRPYLESNFEIENDKSDKSNQDDIQKFPMIWNNNFCPQRYQSDYNQFQVLSSYSSTYHIDSQNVLKFLPNTPPSPTTTLNSPNDSGIMMSPNYILPLSQASPVSGYDSSTSSIYSFNDNEVDLSQENSPVYSSSRYDASSPSISSATISKLATETKVPLTPTLLHDLKFKLYTLDCYYNDADCQRNEKLVAKKLNINCKIVEKWLRQESDLRKQYHLQILV